MNSSTRSLGPTVVLILLTVAYAVSALFVPTGDSLYDGCFFFENILDLSPVCCTGFLSVLFGILCTGVLALGIFLAGNHISSGMNQFIPLIYLVLVLANPASLRFSPLHAAALFLVPALFNNISFCSSGTDLTSLAKSCFMLTLASFFFPPLMWLAVPMAIFSIGKAEDKGKYLFTAIFSLAVPLLLIFGIRYLQSGVQKAAEIFPEYFRAIADIPKKSIAMSASTLCRLVLTAIISIISAYCVAGSFGRYKIVQYTAYTRILVFAAAIAAVVFIFIPGMAWPGCLLTAIPLSLMMNEYFSNGAYSGSGTVAVAALLILLAERIQCFI